MAETHYSTGRRKSSAARVYLADGSGEITVNGIGLGVEVMDTGALCRTFNILVAEDRQVVAAIILSSAASS